MNLLVQQEERYAIMRLIKLKLSIAPFTLRIHRSHLKSEVSLRKPKKPRFHSEFKNATTTLTQSPRFQIPPVWRASRYEKLRNRFRNELVWTVGLAIEMKMRFQIYPAQCGRGLCVDRDTSFFVPVVVVVIIIAAERA